MNRTVLAFSSLAAAALCAGASATVVDITYNGMGYFETISITSPGYSGGVNAGQMLLTAANSSDTNAFANGSYISYCGDYYQNSNTGPNPYSVVGVDLIPNNAPMGAAKAAAIGELYAFAGGAQYGVDSAYACAFQLAIWEVIADYNTIDPSSGAFSASGYSAQAGIYLAALLGSLDGSGSANIVGLTNDTYQDFIVEVPGPGSLALIGVAGLVGARRRRA